MRSRSLQSLYLVSGVLAVEISMDLIKELPSYVGFELSGSGSPHIFSAPWRRNYASAPKGFRSARTCSRSSITVPSLVGLGFHPRPGRPQMLSCFVC